MPYGIQTKRKHLGRLPPVGRVSLATDSHLAQGLTRSLVAFEDGRLRSLIGSAGTPTAVTAGVDRGGRGALFNGTSSFVDLGQDIHNNQSAFTVHMRLFPRFAFDGGDDNYILGVSSAGGGDNFRLRYAGSFANQTWLAEIRGAFGSTAILQAAKRLSQAEVEIPTSIVFSTTVAGNYHVFAVNGEVMEDTTAINGVINNNSQLYIGRYLTSYAPGGSWDLQAFNAWDRALSAEECRDLTRPQTQWDLYWQSRRTYFIPATGVGGGLDIQIAAYHYNHSLGH